MKSSRMLLLCCICLGAFALLDASPAHAAVESAGLFDRATQHFKDSLTKWGDTMTPAATVLFWMLATVAFCWEFGSLALRGASMEAALAYVLRFALIEGIWLYILRNAVPIGTAIIDSLRRLGSTASGLPKELMPSAVLDIGFGILWKAIVFVGHNTLTAPIVSFAALIMALFILVSCALTAINMVVLIVSQWFLLYGGVFFLGFGGAPWTSDKARNYLLLALSIGAQLLGMAAVVGLGQSFMQEQYAQMSGDTSFGELAVLLIVALLVCLLSNEIPKLFMRFTPGYSPQSLGIASLLGATASAAAAVAASAAMAKGALESAAGVVKAVNAAHSAAKAQSSRFASTARSQTGVSSSGLASNGTATTTASPASTQTQGPLGAMLGGNGIGIANPRSGPGERSTSSSRSSTQAAPIEQPGKADSKSTSNPSAPSTADAPQASARTDVQPTAGADAASNTPSHTPRARTQTEAHAHSGQSASDHGQDTSEAHSGPGGAQRDEEESPTGSAADETGHDPDHDRDHEEAEASQGSEAENDTGSAEQEAGETDESERAQNAGTGSDRSRSQNEDDEGASAASEPGAARSEPTGTHAYSSVVPTEGSESTPVTSSTPTSSGSGVATTGSAATSATGAADTAHASPAAQQHPTGATPTPSTAPSSSTGAPGNGATQKQGATASSTTESAPDTAQTKSGTAAASKPSSDVEGAAAPAPSTPASTAGSDTEPAAPVASETWGASGGARGSTSVGVIATTAKILGQQAVQHQADRIKSAISGFSARADQTTGGRIAQAIREKYNLDPAGDTEDASRPMRSHTGARKSAPTESNASRAPASPADWVSGDAPMTENQYVFLERRLGADVDLNMTKAEAAILIEELLDEER